LIEDLDSSNGVFVDGEKVKENEDRENKKVRQISVDSKINLANEVDIDINEIKEEIQDTEIVMPYDEPEQPERDL